MSDANIQVVKQGFDKFFAKDVPGFVELMSEDVQWDHRGPAGLPFNRMYEGKAGVTEWFQTLGEVSEPLAFEPQEFFGDGDRVVVIGFFRWRVKSTGKEWESNWAMAFTVRNGRITHWKPIFDMGAEAAAYQP